jgi:penicillin-binding protein 1A
MPDNLNDLMRQDSSMRQDTSLRQDPGPRPQPGVHAETPRPSEVTGRTARGDETAATAVRGEDGGPRSESGGSGRAGREFLRALADDVARLGRRFGGWLASSKKPRRPAVPVPPRVSATPAAGRTFPRGARTFARAFVLAAVLGCLAVAGGLLWALHDMPVETPIGGADGPSLLLEAANGQSLGRVGPLKLPDAARSEFSDRLVAAVISIEDRRFYSHWGIDPEGILRAFHRNMAAGTIVEGGSTITQQLVKTRMLGHERTFLRKAREAMVAVWLDVRLGKDAILTRYLNSIYLGNGTFGMPAAARFYFDKRPSDLSLPEAAMLAGMIRAPSRDNPLRDLEAAQTRANVVIDTMLDNGVIDADTASRAKAQPAALHLSGQASRAGIWFADWAAKEAGDVTGGFSGHMRVRTTLNPAMQKLAEQAVNDTLAREGAERHAGQAALVAMRPDGAVVAMVGGRDYKASQFNRAADAKRQPGSAFKLFVYFAALRKGMSPDDTVDASTLDIKGWEPENYNEQHFGRVSLRDAFAKSINTAAARLGQEVGLKNVIAAAHDLGLPGELPAVPSLALGTAEVSLIDLTAAYASVRAGRMPVRPWGITGFGIEGQPRLQSLGPPILPQQPLAPYQQPLQELLQEVVQHGTGRAAALDGFAAGKTGTAQDYRDAWFIGFNENLVVGVWVGNDDRSPMDKVTGGSLPAAIWKRFMTDAASAAQRGPQPSEPADSGAPMAQGEPGLDPAQCDYQACARTYNSFRASDCTYQPYGGTRRLCEKGAPRTAAATPAEPSRPTPQPASSDQTPQPQPQPASEDSAKAPRCNVSVCSSFYSSFNASDCTYQPFSGGARRLCDR